MALFRYRALAHDGKKITGVVDADSYLSAKERLRKDQVMVTELFLLDKKTQKPQLEPSLLLAFTRDLTQLLRAGLPLYESLLTIEEKYRHHPAHPLFLDLCDRLKGGASFSGALKHYPESFDAVYLAMIIAGEQSASLPAVFDQISALLSRQQKLKKQLISAMTYPAFLGAFCMIVVFSLLFFVIPSIQELFEGRSLHPLTEAVLGVSRFMNNNILILLALLFSFLAAGYVLIKRPSTKTYLQTLCLRLPFVKTVLVQSSLIRFCRASSVLLSGGVPLIEALALGRKVMRNAAFEQLIENASARVVEGERLSQQLKLSPLVPSLVVRMLAIAEETGNMAPMLQNIADIYDEELEKNLSQMTTFIQPALLIFLGAVVGVVILSILLPLTDVSSFLNQ